MFVIINKNTRCCKVEDNNLKSQLINKGFGYKEDLELYIDFFETNYLLNKDKIKIKAKDNKLVTKKEFLLICNKKIKDFENKYLVFKDFKDQGKIIKDGALFGFDFRIYKNTKNHSHSEYVVDVKTTYKDTMKDVIKSERLANSINTKYIIAIIDNQKKIIKLKIENI